MWHSRANLARILLMCSGETLVRSGSLPDASRLYLRSKALGPSLSTAGAYPFFRLPGYFAAPRFSLRAPERELSSQA